MINLTAYVGGYSTPKEMAAGGSDTTAATTANTNNSTAILPSVDTADKAYKTAQAVAALAGHRLQRHGNVFLVSRWGHAKQLDSLAEVANWLDRVGGPTHV